MLESMDVCKSRVLVVDDNPINTSVLEAMLRKQGYAHIDCCSDPFAVRGLYGEGNYDIVLLDIHMPGLSGLDVLAQLKADHPAGYLPVVVLTADASPDLRLKALAAGAQDFITKPFDKTEIQLRVRNILQVQLLLKQLQEQNRRMMAQLAGTPAG